MGFGASTFWLLVASVFIGVFQLLPNHRTLRLCLLAALNLVFLVWQMDSLFWIPLLVGLIPLLVLRLRPKWFRKMGTPLAFVLTIVFVYFKLKTPHSQDIQTAAAGNAFDQIFQTSLPLGFSFVFFLVLSLIFEMRDDDREKASTMPSFLESFVVLFFAPAMIAGPYLKWSELRLSKFDTPGVRTFMNGLILFFWGLTKKGMGDWIGLEILKSDRFLSVHNSFESWLFALLTVTRIYCDFSGCSDLAVGTGRMVGIELPRNFILPFLSKSVGEYWRRWHVSLGDWFRHYVYFRFLDILISKARDSKTGVLGSTRVGIVNATAMSCTMLMIGLWHGITWHFVIWSVMVSVLLLASPLLRIDRKSILGPYFNIVVTFYLMMWTQLFLVYGNDGRLSQRWFSMHRFDDFSPFAIHPTYLIIAAFVSLIVPHAVDWLIWRQIQEDDARESRRDRMQVSSAFALVLKLAVAIFLSMVLSRAGLPYIYSRF